MLDRLNSAISEYLTSLDHDALNESDHRRLACILAFCTNLEHAGDVIERNLLEHASKRLKRGWRFTPDVVAELESVFARLGRNLHTASSILLSEDVRTARALALEKQVFRSLEDEATATHFARMRDGQADRIEIGALQLDLVRDLKRINAHLVAAAAYPILREEGALLPSRVVQSE